MDYPEGTVIRGDRILRYLAAKDYSMKDRPTFYHNMDQRVLMMTLIPGMGVGALQLLCGRYRSVIYQSFGVGGIPGGGEGSLALEMEEWIKERKCVVVMMQIPYEGNDMDIYHVGKQAKGKCDIIEAHNTTMKAVTSKLM